MFDTHCHLTSPELFNQIEDVLERAFARGVRGMITVATGPDDLDRGLTLAQRFDSIWCTSGVHPHQADQPVDWGEVRRVVEDPKCVAWGELGLDWHYPEPARDRQLACLNAHLDCIERARIDGLDLPVVVHCRESLPDLLAVFRQREIPPERYVFHCFTGTAEEAESILEFGAWISLTGVLTFTSAATVAEAATRIPLDRVMVETDSPYLSPEPVRKVRPNEPAHVVWVARYLADLRGCSHADMEAQLDDNAARFFGLTLPPA